jgi:aminoglycoside phosphotransferase (APT) family kinase protein
LSHIKPRPNPDVIIGEDLNEYCAGLLEQGFSRIPEPEVAPKDEPSYRGSVKEHHQLLKISENVTEVLKSSSLLQNLATPTLLHPDLHKRNIFVSDDDPTIITSIIDWQYVFSE